MAGCTGCKPILSLSLILLISAQLSSAWIFRRGRKPLAINGEWSNWSNWTKCHKNLEDQEDYFAKWKGFTLASKSRECDSPRPLNGGQECKGSQYRYKQCGCSNALGLQNGRITNSQLSSPSELAGYEAFNGRLKGPSAWCAKSVRSLFSNVYLQVEFKNLVEIRAITTEGISRGRVTRYRLEHSLNGAAKSWTLYRHSESRTGHITGNLRYGAKRVDLAHPIVAKYVRINPLHSFGDVCMKVELHGCEFTCGQLFSEPSGKIVGHSSEVVDQNCRWRVTVANTTMVILDFDILQLPCENGYVEVWDASDKAQTAAQKKRFCGTHVPPLHKFPSNDIWISFVSSAWEDENSFILRYMTTCERDVDLGSVDKFDVVSRGYPDDYPHNSDCRWNIVSPNGNFIEAVFLDLDIEESNSSLHCANDVLKVSPKGLVGEGYCNSRRPPRSILYNSTQLTITFKSDSFIVGRGFKVRLRSFDPTTRTTKDTPTTIPITSSKTPTTAAKEIKTVGKKASDSNSTILRPNSNMNHLRPGAPVGVNSTNFGRKKPKDSDDNDDTWTIIIVASFSCIVIFLLIIVGGINIHRCIHGRNMYAMANAKLEQASRNQKARNMKAQQTARMQLLTVEVDGHISPSLGSPIDPPECDNEVPADEEHAVKPEEETPAQNQESESTEELKDSPIKLQVSSEESSTCDFVDCSDEMDPKELEQEDSVPETSYLMNSNLEELPECAESNV